MGLFFLKEDTAVDIKLGPFVDKGDGVAYEVGMAVAMDHADTGVRLSKNGGAFADRTEGTEPSYDAFGYYLVKLDATDTNTSGRLKVIFGDAAVCLPCEANFQVVNANVFDSLFAAATTDYLDVQLKGCDAGVITAASINADAITEAKIADNAIAGEHLNATACTKIIDDFETQSQADPTGFHVNVKEVNGTAQTANDDAADINTILGDLTDGGRLDLLIDAIKTNTDLLPSGVKKNTALAAFEWLMVLAADHVSAATGKTVVCQRSIDGGAFANCNTTPATEVSDGVYKVDLAASDLNGDVITLKFTEATCDTTLITIKTDT